MGNTHGIADMAKELQATTRDLLPACVVTTTWPTVPVPPSLTLAAFATAGYVRDGVDLVYCAQEAHTVTLTGGDGTYWLALTQDSWTTVASWNRTAGTQYMWRASATRPPDVDGLLVCVQVTVSGGNITAVAPASGVTRAEALRALSGLGTLATQNADAVAITGGTATLATLTAMGDVTANQCIVNNVTGSNLSAYYSNRASAGGTNRWFLNHVGDAPSQHNGPLRLGGGMPSALNFQQAIRYAKQTNFGLYLQAIDNDAAGLGALVFVNVAGAGVGSITTTGAATAYNTSSDGRLKEAVAALPAALETILALRPVQFRWKATGAHGEGFVAQEVQPLVPLAVTGDPADQTPTMQMDLAKLVPYLVGACQDLAQQVHALTSRLAALDARVSSGAYSTPP